jgi:5'-nucleotidase
VDFVVARIGSGFHLSIVHTSDSHSRILPETGDGNTQIKSARIATMSKWLRNQRQNVLMLDAGDQFERSNFNTCVHEANNAIINLLNYDCITIGNWDFSYGASLLADYIIGLNCPVVSCNINVENEPLLRGLFDPYTIIEVGEYKVGIVGLATTDRNMYFGDIENIIFEDITTSAQTAVEELKTQGVNIIIALTHIGYYEDAELAANVDGIDIIVGGHSHILLSNTIESAQGPYPYTQQSPSLDSVLIVQAGCYNNYIGCLDIIFDENGVATYWTGDTCSMDNSIPEDEAVSSVVNNMMEELADSFLE